VTRQGVVEEAGRSSIWGWRWWGTAALHLALLALVRIDSNPCTKHTSPHCHDMAGSLSSTISLRDAIS
jgi:hypothetical protein